MSPKHISHPMQRIGLGFASLMTTLSLTLFASWTSQATAAEALHATVSQLTF